MVSPYTKKDGLLAEIRRRRLRKVHRRDERLLSYGVAANADAAEPGIGAGRKTQAATRPCVPSEN